MSALTNKREDKMVKLVDRLRNGVTDKEMSVTARWGDKGKDIKRVINKTTKQNKKKRKKKERKNK